MLFKYHARTKVLTVRLLLMSLMTRKKSVLKMLARKTLKIEKPIA
jgi:hypothetical protein